MASVDASRCFWHDQLHGTACSNRRRPPCSNTRRFLSMSFRGSLVIQCLSEVLSNTKTTMFNVFHNSSRGSLNRFSVTSWNHVVKVHHRTCISFTPITSNHLNTTREQKKKHPEPPVFLRASAWSGLLARYPGTSRPGGKRLRSTQWGAADRGWRGMCGLICIFKLVYISEYNKLLEYYMKYVLEFYRI